VAALVNTAKELHTIETDDVSELREQLAKQQTEIEQLKAQVQSLSQSGILQPPAKP